MFKPSDSRSIGASLDKLNSAKIGQKQAQHLLFIIVIVAIRDNDYSNIYNNNIPALPTLHL